MERQAGEPHFERRWPVALAFLAVSLLLALLPARIVVVPRWAALGAGIAMLTPIVAVGLTGGRKRWLRVERGVTFLFFGVTAVFTIINLANLISAIINRSGEVTGIELLTSSVAVWISNVLVFSLLYWQMDRGGPEARVNRRPARTDWLFPQQGAPAEDVPSGWRPQYVDYLYLSYSTATAFSTTDVMPLTARAKLLMMLESSISLVTLVVVGARAINIFGS